MNTAASPLVRPLQGIAVALAFAIVALAVAWSRLEPEPSPASGANAPAPGGAAVLAAATADAEPAVPGAAAPAVGAPRSAAAAGDAAATAASAVLYGTVRSADGEPVAGVLWLYRDGEHVGTESLQAGKRAFAFGGLLPGAHRITWRFDDQLPGEHLVDVVAPRTRSDIELPPRWRLMVHAVTPDGAPLLASLGKVSFQVRSVVAIALPEPLARDLPPTHLSAVEGGLGAFRSNGVFRESVLPKTAVGVLALPPDRPVHVALLLRNTLLAQQVAAPGTDELTFTLAPDVLLGKTARVRVRIVDEGGAPVAGARVSLTDGQTGSAGSKTDDEGRIEFTNVTPGRLDLGVRHPDLRGPPLLVDVAAGTDLDLGDVVLRPPVTFEMSFENFGGRGSAYLRLLDLDARPGFAADDRWQSAENGAVQKVALFPGRYAVLARGKDGVAVQVLDTAVLAGQRVRFDLARGAMLRLVGSAEVSLPRQLTIRTRDGLPVFQRDVHGALGYSIELPPGDYEAMVVHADGSVTRHAIALPREGASFTVP